MEDRRSELREAGRRVLHHVHIKNFARHGHGKDEFLLNVVGFLAHVPNAFPDVEAFILSHGDSVLVVSSTEK